VGRVGQCSDPCVMSVRKRGQSGLETGFGSRTRMDSSDIAEMMEVPA